LNILVPCQLFDKGNVGAAMQQRCAKSVPQQMRGQFLSDAGFGAEPLKQLGHVVARQPPRLFAGGNEDRRMSVSAKAQESAHPAPATRRDKHGTGLVALAYDFDLAREVFCRVPVQR
jgi:hypothetical protein